MAKLEKKSDDELPACGCCGTQMKPASGVEGYVHACRCDDSDDDDHPVGRGWREDFHSDG